MTKNKVDDDRQSDTIDGVVKPKVRWFDGSMHLDVRQVARSVPFRDKLAKVEQLERRLRND